MVLGSLRTNKGWGELKEEVQAEFDRWGFHEVVFPTKKDALNSGAVTVLVKTKSGDWTDLKCAAFKGSDGPERNPVSSTGQALCAVREAVRGFRLADQRGIAALFADMTKLLALPPPEDDGDPYSALGVSRSAGKDQLRRAYRERVKRAHPDHGGSQDEFIRVQEAGKALGVA